MIQRRIAVEVRHASGAVVTWEEKPEDGEVKLIGRIQKKVKNLYGGK